MDSIEEQRNLLGNDKRKKPKWGTEEINVRSNLQATAAAWSGVTVNAAEYTLKPVNSGVYGS